MQITDVGNNTALNTLGIGDGQFIAYEMSWRGAKEVNNLYTDCLQLWRVVYNRIQSCKHKCGSYAEQTYLAPCPRGLFHFPLWIVSF